MWRWHPYPKATNAELVVIAESLAELATCSKQATIYFKC